MSSSRTVARTSNNSDTASASPHARQPDVIKRIHDDFRSRLRDLATRRQQAAKAA